MTVVPFPDPADVADDDGDETAMYFTAARNDGDYDDQPIEPVNPFRPPEETVPSGTGEYKVGEHECIGSIATALGLLPETLRQANESLRSVRSDGFVLLPQDRLTIPERKPGTRRAATGKRHRFVRKRVPLHLRLDLSDEEDAPYREALFVIDGEGFHETGTTTGEGFFDVCIPSGMEHATVRFPDRDETLKLSVGTLDPVTTIQGVQARLNNMFYDCGPATGEWNLPTLMALNRFRADEKLAAQEGLIVDEATLQRLVERQGC